MNKDIIETGILIADAGALIAWSWFIGAVSAHYIQQRRRILYRWILFRLSKRMASAEDLIKSGIASKRRIHACLREMQKAGFIRQAAWVSESIGFSPLRALYAPTEAGSHLLALMQDLPR